MPHLLADEEHRRLVALALADDDGAVDGHGVHLASHGLDGSLVRQVTVALAHGVGAGDGRLLDHAQELQREVRFHRFFVVAGGGGMHGDGPFRGAAGPPSGKQDMVSNSPTRWTSA
jgi:hypothetical protein